MDKDLTTAGDGNDAVESEEFFDSFLCCICLDLLYKPIVLSCGHISCFWCVHKSMNVRQKSYCPICRHPYGFCPTVCEMLHSLLLKMYPVSYKRREGQTLAEEKLMGYFSPQFDNNESRSSKDQECYHHLEGHRCLSTTRLESDLYSEACSTSDGEPKENCNQLSITDVQCSSCKQLLFHPVFLNCGHGYCQACILTSPDKMLTCQVCQSLHPADFPEVCLVLDHFLEEQFPIDYALRRDAVLLAQDNANIEKSSDCTAKASRSSTSCSKLKEELFHSKLHAGAGCDFCGMFPIIGDRYRCKDCVEKIGFDLCGDCYETRSKRPGRFNQQHMPDHEFELVNPINLHPQLMALLNGPLGYDGLTLANSADVSDVAEIESPASLLVSGDAEDEVETGIILDRENDQNESQPTN